MLFENKERFRTHVTDVVRVMKEYHGSKWTLRRSIVHDGWTVTNPDETPNLFNSFESAFNFLVDMEWIAQMNENEYNR